MLPLTALIVGTGVLGSEIDDGTLLHFLAKPLPRYEILLTKLALAAAVGATAYSTVFVAMSLLTRRPELLGLLYVVLWEGCSRTSCGVPDR